MKQKKINNILYVFDTTPYQITQDTDAEIIKVQEESYKGFVDLNESLADKFVKFNYKLTCVTPQEWMPYIDADDKPSPELAWSAASATVTIGADDNIFPTLSNPHSVTVTYTSSDSEKATIDASTGSITLVAEGNTTISAVFAGNDDYAAQTVTYALTVQQAQPQPLPSPELAWSEESATVIIGESNSFPSLSNPHGVTVSYESSDTTKATIDASTGLITLVAEGNTTISASFAGDSELAPQTVSYALTVQQDQPSVGHTLTLDGSYIHANVNVYFDNVQQTVEYQYQDVAENTVIDIYPTQDPSYYTLNQGATWDTDHWTTTMPDADLIISINYNEPASTITVTAPYGLDIFDEANTDWVTMTPVGESQATEATGTLTVGGTYSVEQRSGIGQGKEVTFSPSCGTGQQGTVGAEFIAPNQDLTITLSQPQPQTITVTAPNGLMIYDEQSQQQVIMTPVGESEPTEATGTLTVGVQYEIEQGMGAGRNKWPRFSPSCSTGTYGGSGEIFTAPATDLTITLLSYPDMHYTPNAATVTIGDPNNVFPTLYNPNNYTITYSSNDTSVATVDQSTGVVTLITSGNTNINAMTTGYSGPAQGTGYPLTVNAGDSNPE